MGGKGDSAGFLARHSILSAPAAELPGRQALAGRLEVVGPSHPIGAAPGATLRSLHLAVLRRGLFRKWWWKLLICKELDLQLRSGLVDASPRRAVFYGEVPSSGRPMLTVRSEIGP